MKGSNNFMGKDITAQLKKINWFDELPDDILAALTQKVNMRTLSKNEVLFKKVTQAIHFLSSFRVG